jgi:hypothetical protein
VWPFLQWLVGAIVWALANVVFIDMRRKNVAGFAGVAAFVVGMPLTLITMFVVKERRGVPLEPPKDDEDELLLEVRRDREARRVEGTRDTTPVGH